MIAILYIRKRMTIGLLRLASVTATTESAKEYIGLASWVEENL